MRRISLLAVTLLALFLCSCGGSGGGGAGTPNYTVVFTAGTHGSVTGTTSQTVASGTATTSVLAVPAAGYYFVDWTGDNGFVTSTANPLGIAKITASQNITANFALYPSRAVLKLSSAGSLPAGSSLSGINVKVQLPAGVTVTVDGSNVVAAGVVTASGVAAGSSVTPAIYTPATATAPATLEFLVWSTTAQGFGLGEFTTVTCVVESGRFPTGSDFILPASGFKPADLLLQPVGGLTVTLSAEIS